MKPKGWRGESRRHSMARKGIGTARGNEKAVKSPNEIKYEDIVYYTDQDDVSYVSDKELIEIFSRLKKGDAIILDDNWRMRFLIWELDGKLYIEGLRQIEDNYDEVYMRYDLDMSFDDFVEKVNEMYPDLKVVLEAYHPFPKSPNKLKQILKEESENLLEAKYRADYNLSEEFQ